MQYNEIFVTRRHEEKDKEFSVQDMVKSISYPKGVQWTLKRYNTIEDLYILIAIYPWRSSEQRVQYIKQWQKEMTKALESVDHEYINHLYVHIPQNNKTYTPQDFIHYKQELQKILQWESFLEIDKKIEENNETETTIIHKKDIIDQNIAQSIGKGTVWELAGTFAYYKNATHIYTIIATHPALTQTQRQTAINNRKKEIIKTIDTVAWDTLHIQVEEKIYTPEDFLYYKEELKKILQWESFL